MVNPHAANPRIQKMRAITEIISEQMGINYEHIVAARDQRSSVYQRSPVVLARHVAMWLVRQILRASLHEVGRFFHVDHTTVHNACARIDSSRLPAEATASIDSVLFGEHTRWGQA